MVTSIVLVIRIAIKLAVLITFIIFVRIIVFRLESSFSVVLTLSSETCLGLTHFVELLVNLIFSVFLEDLILLVLEMLVFQFLDYLLLFGTTLSILQIVHVELVLEVVNVGVLLNICAIEAF